MKKKVSIFVAGSKDLKTERYALKALVHELNTRYHEKGIDVLIEMKSFEDFKDRQTEYENYISQKADMALFVLDGYIGDYTKREFNTAVDAYKQKQIPEIVVFLKKFNEETDGIKHIQDLLKDRFGDDYFYVSYDDEADLRTKAETRIRNFISPTDYIRNVKKWRIITFCLAIFALLCIGGLLTTSLMPKSKTIMTPFSTDEKMLLFFGGGSVYKYLADEFEIEVDSLDNISNSIYIPVPTGNLWYMIAEEFYRDLNKARFNPLFLAADTINKNELNSGILAKGEIMDRMLIFQLFLGEDSTITHIGDNALEALGLKELPYDSTSVDGKILYYQNANQLQKLVSKALENRCLYTTTPKSGTLKSYMNVLGKSYNIVDTLLKDSICHFHKVYNEHNALASIIHDYVLLGSEHYYPMKMMGSDKQIRLTKSGSNRMLYLKNDSGFVAKKLYMYFIAYVNVDSDKRSSNEMAGEDSQTTSTIFYEVPSEVKAFLALLNSKMKKKNMHIDETSNSVWDKIVIDGRIKKEDVVSSNGIVSLAICEKKDK